MPPILRRIVFDAEQAEIAELLEEVVRGKLFRLFPTSSMIWIDFRRATNFADRVGAGWVVFRR
jgi:hypothetical protein